MEIRKVTIKGAFMKSDEADGIITLSGTIPVTEFVKITNDPNVRVAQKTEPVKAMEKTLKESPETFLHQNNGATIIASGYEPSCGEVTLMLKYDEQSEEFIDGIVNGGSTQLAVINSMKDGIDVSKASINVKIICGENISEAYRNSIKYTSNESNSPTESTKMDASHYFDFIKESMEYRDMIMWKQGSKDKKTSYKIDNFIKLLAGVCLEKGFEDIDSCTNKTKMLEYILEGHSNELYSYSNLFDSLCVMHDNIIMSYNEEHDAQRIPNIDTIITGGAKNKKTTIFTKKTYKATLPEIVICMILYGMRCNLIKGDDGKWNWKIDPNTLLKKCEFEVWETISEATNKHRTSANKSNLHASINRNPGLWVIITNIFTRTIGQYPIFEN